MKSLPNFVLDGSRDPMKQMRAHKTKLKQPQDGARLSLNQPQETKGIEPGRSTKRKDTCKDKIAWPA